MLLFLLCTGIVDLIRYVKSLGSADSHNADPRRAHGRGDRSYRITVHMNLLKKRRRCDSHPLLIWRQLLSLSAVIVIIFQCDYHLTVGFFTLAVSGHIRIVLQCRMDDPSLIRFMGSRNTGFLVRLTLEASSLQGSPEFLFSVCGSPQCLLLRGHRDRFLCLPQGWSDTERNPGSVLFFRSAHPSRHR